MSGQSDGSDTATRPGRAPARAPAWLRCRRCDTRVALAVSAVHFDGAHRHRFSNPAGFAFDIALYDDAPGCETEGDATEYWSWFPGYAWQAANCRGCRTHLGWYYACIGTPTVGEPPDFHGLIVDRLREN